jgi:putative oxidoreductase
MTFFHQLEKWSDRNHSAWMDVLRMVLGITLTVKGFMFIMDTSDLVRILNANFGIADGIIWAHVIAILHLATGFLITIGLATRASCLIDIPMLIAAILFVNINSTENRVGELLISVIILLLLVFFFLKGSGRFSAFYYLINSRRSRETDESRGDYKGGSPVAPMDKEANIL